MERGVPGLKFFFFVPLDNTVIPLQDARNRTTNDAIVDIFIIIEERKVWEMVQ